MRHLLVRKAQKTGELLIALVTTTQETHDLEPLVMQLLSLPLQGKITGILHTKMILLQMLFKVMKQLFYMVRIIL